MAFSLSDDIIYPRRPSLRLSAYDYSSPGSYFVTICAARRDCVLFCQIGQQSDLFSDPPVSLTPLGFKIKQSILSIPAVNPGVAVDCYVIMPDHVHLLLNLTGQYGGHPLSKVIQRFKSYTDHLYQTDGQPFGPKLWQRGYHDHILPTRTICFKSEITYKKIPCAGANVTDPGILRYPVQRADTEVRPYGVSRSSSKIYDTQQTRAAL